MLSISRCPIDPDETSGSLYNKLAELGTAALLDDLGGWKRALPSLWSKTIARAPMPAKLIKQKH